MKNKIVLIFAIALFLRLIFAFGSWHPDLNNHVDWGERFFQYGPQKFFAPESNVWNYTWPNQPPGTILMFAGVYQLFQIVFSIFTAVNNTIPAFPSQIMFFLEDTLYQALLKLPSILADVGIAWLIYKVVKQHASEKKAQFATLLFLFNPVIWYNSSAWGQTDAIINFLFLLGVYLASKNKLLLSMIFVALCLFVKLSLAIFIPIYIIYIFKQKYAASGIIISTIVSILLIAVLSLLFSFPAEPLSWLARIYQEKVLTQQLHVITANAFNLWSALTGIHEQPDKLLLGPLAYYQWGSILFAIAYLPLLYILAKSKSQITIYAVLAVAAFASFTLMTNMHERYLYPLFPYLTILVALFPKLLLGYLIVSVIHLLNLYNFWFVPRIEPVVQFLSFGDRLMPRILGAVMVGLFIHLYLYIIKLWRNGSWQRS